MIPESRAQFLLDKWLATNPQPCPAGVLKRRLAEEFGAYEIPLNANSAQDFRNDEEVREMLLDALFTITDRDVRLRIYGPVERGMQNYPSEIEDRDWRSLFDSDPGAPEDGGLAYSLLLVQHRLGQRTSIALEREGEMITGFKVYGHSDYVSDWMTAMVGFPERPEGPKPEYPTMIRGDLRNEEFVYYLECLARFDFFQPNSIWGEAQRDA